MLVKSQRCDLLLPLKGNAVVQRALHELLFSPPGGEGTLYDVLRATVGDEGTLYELAALVSEPGSPRQPVHPDNPYQESAPLFTSFVALQDISPEMVSLREVKQIDTSWHVNRLSLSLSLSLSSTHTYTHTHARARTLTLSPRWMGRARRLSCRRRTPRRRIRSLTTSTTIAAA